MPRELLKPFQHYEKFEFYFFEVVWETLLNELKRVFE